MSVLQEIIQNRMIVAPVIAWFAAQVIKVIIHAIINKKIDLERMIGSGGMPSSHSSTVCALATVICIIKGVSSFEFAMTLIFAIVVMYDAMNVRMETGKQAVVLNILLRNEELKTKLMETAKNKWPQQILKEYVGHTPMQVLMGMLLGILIGWLTGIA